MKYPLNILLTLFLISLTSLTFGSEKSKPVLNKHVQFKVSIVEKAIKPGSAGTIQISLTPVKGIHINLDPPMSLKLDSTASITKVDELITHKNDANGYLDFSKPITVKFSVAKNTKPGKLSLKGIFIYFFCSDAEGWCNRYKQPIDLIANISK